MLARKLAITIPRQNLCFSLNIKAKLVANSKNKINVQSHNCLNKKLMQKTVSKNVLIIDNLSSFLPLIFGLSFAPNFE